MLDKLKSKNIGIILIVVFAIHFIIEFGQMFATLPSLIIIPFIILDIFKRDFLIYLFLFILFTMSKAKDETKKIVFKIISILIVVGLVISIFQFDMSSMFQKIELACSLVYSVLIILMLFQYGKDNDKLFNICTVTSILTVIVMYVSFIFEKIDFESKSENVKLLIDYASLIITVLLPLYFNAYLKENKKKLVVVESENNI